MRICLNRQMERQEIMVDTLPHTKVTKSMTQNETRDAILKIRLCVQEQADRYAPATSEFDPILDHIDGMLKWYPEKKKRSIAGRALKVGDGVMLFFKVNGVLYQHNERNGELIDAYMHTGDESYLGQLEGGVPF